MNIFSAKSLVILASKLRAIIPDSLIIATIIEKINPETTGAGIAYFFKAFEWLTHHLPEKITKAAIPNVHKYSNWKVATSPFSPGV